MVSEYNEKLYEKPTKNSNGDFDFSPCDNKLARFYTQGSEILPVRVITPVGASAPETKITDGTDLLLINSDGSLNIVNNELSLSIASNSASGATATVITGAANGTRIYGIHHSLSGSAGTGSVLLNGTTVSFLQMVVTGNYSRDIDIAQGYLTLGNGQTLQVSSSAGTNVSSCTVIYRNL